MEPIVIAWETGRYTLDPAALLQLPAARLKKIMAQGTVDAEASRERVRSLIEDHRRAYKAATSKEDKAEYMRLGKLIEAVETGKKTVNPAAKPAERVIKRAPDSYKGTFERDGLYCVSDGYMLLALRDPLPDTLPTVPGGLNVKQAFDGATEGAHALDLPTLADVRQNMRLAKSAPSGSWCGDIYPEPNGRTLYDFGPGRPVVNLELLRDMLEALPGARAVVRADGPSPIVFDSDAGRGLLLPVKIQGHAAETRRQAEPEPVKQEDPAPVRRELTPDEFLTAVTMTPEEFAALVA